MKTFLMVALTFIPVAFVSAQSNSRYGSPSEPPAGLGDIEAAFSNTPPPAPAAAAGRGRYGGNSGVPSLPPSTPEVARNELRALSPSPRPQPPTSPSPRRAAPSRPATPQPARGQLPSNRSLATSQPSSRFQRPSGVTLPEGRLEPTSNSRSVLTSSPPSKAQRFISQMLQHRQDSRLRGTRVTVAEVTRGASTRDEQSHRVEAYWDLCASVADYHLGLIEAVHLDKLKRQAPAMSQSLRVAEQSLRNRLDTSYRAAVAGQRRLASMMGSPGLMPLPGDGPFCGVYRTEFETLFANRASGSAAFDEAQQLHELLPLRHAELVRAADAIERSQAFVQRVADNSRNSDGTAMLRALELLALNRRAFVQIAKDYNRRIARYTELSNPGRVDTNVLVAMLVGSSDRVAVNSVASLR